MTLAFAQVPVGVLAAVAAVWWLPPTWQPLRVPLMVVLGLFVATFPLRTFQAALVGLQNLAFSGTCSLQDGGRHRDNRRARAARLRASRAGGRLVRTQACRHRVHRAPAPDVSGGDARRLSFGADGATKTYVAQSFWVA